MGTPWERFRCKIFLPRQPLERTWVLEVCQTLWRHGMTFAQSGQLLGTWEEQLHVLPPSPGYPDQVLSKEIDELIIYGEGSLPCFDHRVEFNLHFDTNLLHVELNVGNSPEEQAVLNRLFLGELEWYVRYPVISLEERLPALTPTQAPASAYLIPPYQQIHLALLHWLEILCLKLQPVFAVGYYAPDSYLAPEDDFLYKFDLATITALQQQQFPPLHEWLTSVYALYVPEPLMASPQAEEWLSSPGMWRRQLSNQAWLAYRMPETLDEVRVRELNAAAATILDYPTRDRTQFPLARIYLQRAQEIAAITRRPYTGARLLDQLNYMEEHPEMFE